MQKSKQIVSLRLNSILEQEIEYLQKALGMSFSNTIREAIHSKYLEIKKSESKRTPKEILEQSGFIGSFKGPENLSTEYKNLNLKNL